MWLAKSSELQVLRETIAIQREEMARLAARIAALEATKVERAAEKIIQTVATDPKVPWRKRRTRLEFLLRPQPEANPAREALEREIHVQNEKR